MTSPYTRIDSEDQKDAALVDAAVQGDRAALEELVSRHQAWIYNIAVRMVGNPRDAQDVTQEVLLKVLLRLSTFRQASSFRTWMYRIVANHVLTIRRNEQRTITFTEYAKAIDNTPDLELPDASSLPVDTSILVEETRIECMMGMLLCLDPVQRLTFILGGLMGVSDSIGSEILDISKANFRQRLSRARRDLQSFMERKCGLVNADNPCRCAKKTRALIERGVVNARSLLYNTNYFQTIRQAIGDKLDAANSWFEMRWAAVVADQPFYSAPAFAGELRALLDNPRFQEIFDLKEPPRE